MAFILLGGGGEDPTTRRRRPRRPRRRPRRRPPSSVPPARSPSATGPDGIAVGAGAVWAVASRDGTLTRIDPATGETTSVDVGENPDSVVVAFDSVWVSVTGENKVVRLTADAAARASPTSFDVGARPEGLAASSRAIWVANSGDGSVSQIVEATGDVRSVAERRRRAGRRRGRRRRGLGRGRVRHAASPASTAAALEVAATVDGIGPNPRAVTIIGRDVWVATSGDGRVYRIDGDANEVQGSVRVGGTPRDIATDGEFLFVTDREGDRLVTVDPQAEQVVERETVEDGPLSVAARRRRPVGDALRRRRRRPHRAALTPAGRRLRRAAAGRTGEARVKARPECVGWWLDEYLRENPSDHTFSELRVLEHPLEGIEPLVIERPRGFLDYFRDPLAGVTYHPDLHEPAREELYA